MLIFEKLGYNKNQAIWIHNIIIEENNFYKENYFYKQNHNKNLIGGNKEEKQIFHGHKITWVKSIHDEQIHYSLNTLKTGLPWHIKYNFEPYDTENMKLDETNKIKIIANSRILSRTKTSIITEKNLFLIDDFILPIYKKYINDSTINFFNELFENHNNCKYIENIQDKLITDLLLFNITGISYFINLTPNKNKYL